MEKYQSLPFVIITWEVKLIGVLSLKVQFTNKTIL